MATTDPTTLEAVNEMLAVLNIPAATALDTGGTSDEAEAERVLDRVSRKAQRIHPQAGNLRLGVSVTSSGGGEITAPSGSYAVWGNGAESIKPLDIVNSLVWDAQTGSSNGWGNAQTYIFNFYVEQTFSQCSPIMREFILAQAKLEYMRQEQRDTVLEESLQSEIERASSALPPPPMHYRSEPPPPFRREAGER